MSATVCVERPEGLARLPFEAHLIVYPDGPTEPGVSFWTADGFVSRCVSAIAAENLPDAERVCRLLNADAIAKAEGEGVPMTEHPMQPIEIDAEGIARFKANAIVSFLLDAGPFDMNNLALRYFTDEDRAQFAQLIGHSVSGWGELDYVDPKKAGAADALAEQILAGRRGT